MPAELYLNSLPARIGIEDWSIEMAPPEFIEATFLENRQLEIVGEALLRRMPPPKLFAVVTLPTKEHLEIAGDAFLR